MCLCGGAFARGTPGWPAAGGWDLAVVGADGVEVLMTKGANNYDTLEAEGANFVEDYDTYNHVDLGPGAALDAHG